MPMRFQAPVVVIQQHIPSATPVDAPSTFVPRIMFYTSTVSTLALAVIGCLL